MGKGGGVWGAIFGAISATDIKTKDILAQQQSTDAAKFFKKGTFFGSQTIDFILFFGMLLLLIILIYAWKK